MNDQAAQRAIKAALAGNWDEAIEFNLQALKNDSSDTDTLNRLARAYAAIGQTKNAQKTWNKVLHFDPYNSIALQQLAKLKHRGSHPPTSNLLAADTFVDEPGKTKTVSLCRLANMTFLLSLEPGQAVNLILKKRSIEINTTIGQYLGCLPDDISAHLLKLIKAGNKYAALVRRVGKNTAQIFLKEIKRAKRYQHVPSFSIQTTSPTLELDNLGPVNESPIDVVATGEDGEQ